MRDRELNSRLAANNVPALTARDARRYRALLLAKRDELAAAAEGAESLVPPANDKSGDLVDWARADTEAELQIHRRHSDAYLMRAIDHSSRRFSEVSTPCVRGWGVVPAGSTCRFHSNARQTSVGLTSGLAYARTI